MIGRTSRHGDRRGWLTELFRIDELPENFIPVMCYISMTKPGEARGPHEHKKQSDCLAFPGVDRFRIFLWDNRRGSLTYKKQLILESSDMDTLILIIPPGVVHGYKNTGSNDGLVVNAPNALYGGPGRREAIDEIRHEDNPESPFKIP